MPWDWSDDDSEGSEEALPVFEQAGSRLNRNGPPGDGPTDYANQYDGLDDDVLGSDSDDADPFDFDKKKKRRDEDEEEENPPYMLFDFRHGPTKWPEGVELVNQDRANELLEKAKEAAAAEAKRQQEKELKDKDGKGGDPKGGKEKGKKGRGAGTGGEVGPQLPKGQNFAEWWLDSPRGGDDEDDAPTKNTQAPEGAKFETLKDGSTALIVPPGVRLKLDCNNLLEGGDAKKEEREKAEKRKRKRRNKLMGGWGGFGKDDYDWKTYWKEWVNEYTITMDIKLLEDPPREGMSLFQTALIHAGESQKGGKSRLKSSEGEALVSSAGGVGVLGTFGDVTKSRLRANRWHRVAVSVKCAADAKQKGEMLTWIDAVSGAVLKSDSIGSNGRFALDPSSLFLLSSSQHSMMARSVAVRTVRVEAKATTDQEAKQGLARDRVLSMFNLEREKEIDAQRQGLALSSLFAKPRPVWSAPAMVGTFGDPFIEGTIFEGASCLAWSFQVLNLVFQRMLADQTSIFASAAAAPTRNALGDVAHIIKRSAPLFKDMVRLLKNTKNSQLMSFLRKLRQQLSGLPEGESLLLPAMVQQSEILLLLERTSERSFTLVVINTDPWKGLRFHSFSPAVKPSKLMFRTCMVLSGIPKKNALDDVFWMAVYNLALSSREGDMAKFYDTLLPFLTDKPLEVSLVEAESAAAADADATKRGVSGPWRTPQRAATQYVRCIFQAVNFILQRRRGVSALRAKQVGLAVRLQFMDMILNDLKYMHPDDNGQRSCAIAMRQISYRAVKIVQALSKTPDTPPGGAEKQLASSSLDECVICLEELDDPATKTKLPCGHTFHTACLDEMVASGNKSNACPLCRDDLHGAGSVESILDKVRSVVDQCRTELAIAWDEDLPLPSKLDLTLSSDWFSHPLAWDVEPAQGDPGQIVALQKFVPADMLQIASKVRTRDDAVNAVRVCDKLCTILDNQEHCVKNHKFLIVALIEHVFIQVLPVPKPRSGLKDESDERRAGRSERRREKEAEKLKAAMQKREELRKAKAGKKGKEGKTDKDDEDAMEMIEELDMSPGKAAEERAYSETCIWDQDITYELQLELTMSLRRLMEHFAAAAFSINPTRSFDAVRIVVSGCVCAITDALLRRRATNHPSEAAAQLTGRDATGRQLGLRGFGIGVATFASQTETMEVHTPEVVVARAAILDYFESPAQKKLEKIFTWDDAYALTPGRPLIKFLRMTGREIALQSLNPHRLLVDTTPESSILMHNYPEIQCYRDIVFYWKYFLNPDPKVFPNAVDESEWRNPFGNTGSLYGRMQAVLAWSWDEDEKAYHVESEMHSGMHCFPNPDQVDRLTGRKRKADELPKHRYPSTATPSYYVPAPPLRTEDDAIYRANLPTFDDDATGKGGTGVALGQRDSELLIAALTVPYIRVPLVINFFASDDRVHKLASAKLRAILDSVLFEPGKHLSLSSTDVEPKVVPTQHQGLLGCAYGLLLNELYRSPQVTCTAVMSLLDAALALDTGSVCGTADTTFNTSVMIILYVCRMAARVLNYIQFVVARVNHADECLDVPVREQPPEPTAMKALLQAQEMITEKLCGQYSALLDDYLGRLHDQTVATPEDETLINRNSRLACDLHAHKLLCLRTLGAPGARPLDQGSATTLLGSFVYLTTRHTWNKTGKDGMTLMPETELYELLAMQRRRLVQFTQDLTQLPLDTMLQTALHIATSTTGALGSSSDIIDVSNRWGKLAGYRSAGRFGVASTRQATVEPTDQATPTAVVGEKPSEVQDTGLLGVEMDLQLGQMTLRSKHLAALESDIANLADVRLVFGETTMQASLLERAENRRRYRLVGVRHEIEFWPDGDKSCPPLGEQWERDYDPAELFDSERWLPPLFEPVRKSFFDGPSPPPMQFMLTKGPLPDDAEVAVLLGLHPSLGGPFKLVYLFRQYRCVHVYECVSHARQWWFSLHLSTNHKFALRYLQPSYDYRVHPVPDWWKHGAGAAYPRGCVDSLRADINPSPGFAPTSPSAAIVRDAAHTLNLSGGRETFVPAHLLYGLIPHALLDTHRFWQDETPPGTHNRKRVRGYPQAAGSENLLVVDIYGSDAKNITGRPERVVRVESRKLTAAQQEFEVHTKITAKIEALQLAMHPPKKKGAEKKDVGKGDKPSKAFSVDDRVETLASDLVTGMADDVWVPCKVLSFNSDGTYDVEYTNEWSWVGMVKNVAASQIREPQDDVEGKNVWIFDGLSDSEDEAWKSDESDEDYTEEEEEEEDEKRVVLSFEQIQRLDSVLRAAGGDLQDCERALEAISAAGKGPYADMEVLASAVKTQCGSDPDEGAAAKSGKPKAPGDAGTEDQRMLLLNLMYAPRRSKLFSLAKTLSNIESLSHICVWTKDVKMSSPDGYTIDLVELPRLKLTFTSRPDHEGVHRLFSLDHADLFVSNDHNALTTKMLAGIPHSLLLSNLRGEMQLLVPVLPPHRPLIITQPYSTDLVIDRVNKEWIQSLSQRFYLYPVHVSLSFAMTKGLNSALYLLLLRLLHREYDGAFRLCDSIATDSKLSPEGVQIFKAFQFAEDDYHPDCFAVRLKVSLVTIDSGTPPPWDLTMQLSEYILKLPHVSATCRLPVQEELQLLESDSVVLDENSPKYKQEIHDVYSLALVKNRLHQLRASLGSGGDLTTCPCFAPPREASTGWPWYQDNTVFGEQYNTAADIKSDKEWEAAMEEDSLRQELAPPGGWLTLVCFHVLWSAGSVKLMLRIADLVPMHPWVHFLNAKADCRGMDVVAKQFEVEQFPTLILLRGGKEVEDGRITGAERGIERLLRLLAANVTDADRSAHAHLLHRQRTEAGDEDADDPLEDEGPVCWTWDVDMCGPQLRVSDMGLTASLKEEDFAFEEPPTWEWKVDWEWNPCPQDVSDELERRFRKGHFFRNDDLRLDDGRFSRQCCVYWDLDAIKITEVGLENLEGYWYDDGEDFEMRRRGERVHVKGEEKFVSKAQKQIDARMQVWKEQQEAIRMHQRKERFGKTTEAIRGTMVFAAGTGKHQWTLKWQHEPILAGKGDAVCLGTAEAEVAGPCEPPLLGGNYDDGASIALYATGELYHKGKVLDTAKRVKPRVLVEEDIFSIKKGKRAKAKKEDGEEAGGGEGADGVKGDSPEKSVSTKGKQKYANAEEGYAALWGKGSSVTLMLDSDKDGGEVTFEVDGEVLPIKISNLYQLLGQQEVFPGVCLTPLDNPFEADQKKRKKKGGNADSEVGTETTGKSGDSEEEEGEEKEEEEDDEAEVETAEEGGEEEDGEDGQADVEEEAEAEAEAEADQDEEEEEEEDDDDEEEEVDDDDDDDDGISPEIKELSKNTKISVEDLQKMSEDEREELAERVKIALEFFNTARVTITAPVHTEIKTSAPGDADKSVNQTKEEGEDAEAENAAAGERSGNADEASQPIERIRWMWEGPNGWEVYSPEISRELETARRAGKAEHTLRIGESTYICMIKADGGDPTQECNDETQRMRRHFMAEGLPGQWEMMSVKYTPPVSLYGESALKVLQNVWSGEENFMGRSAGLGFIFVYCLLQGQKRCKVVSGGYSDWWKQDYGLSVTGSGYGGGGGYGGYGSRQTGSSSSDSHRLGLLLAQLYGDRHTKSVWSSVINVMGRNKQLCVRLPEFKDTRKMKQTQIFNGWTDELESRSPINELFSKLVPLMQGLKKGRQGSFVFPPKPPHPELPSPPAECSIAGGGDTSNEENARWLRPELSDFGCAKRVLEAVSADKVLSLASAVQYQLFTSNVSGEPPLELEDEIHFDELIATHKDRLFIVYFHATWCSPCRSFGPLFRRLALDTPGPRFVRADVDLCDRLASRLETRTLPTIKFMRGGTKKEHVVGSIEVGIEDHIVERFIGLLGEVSTPAEIELTSQRGAPSADSAKKSEEIAGLIAATDAAVAELMTHPLASVSTFVHEESRLQRGLPALEPKLSFDVSQHDAARTAVAKSMLTRMKDDVAAFATAANHQPSASLSFLPDTLVRKYFDGDQDAAKSFLTAKDKVAEVVQKLVAVRESDSAAVQSAIALITCAANYIDLGAGGYSQRKERSEFVLRRTAGQAAEAWPEFLFGAVLSTQGAADVQGLNPYVPRERAETIMGLVLLTMLRANRVGHLNRCIGAAVTLTKLLRQAEKEAHNEMLVPKVLQAAEDLAGMLASRRHFAETAGEQVSFDPRFLMFEFVWNLLLRRKQIEIVQNFVSVVRAGGSKVKQMIMGAGKTTVVAPLMTLMLADGESLVLSVVPKALLEMSRTQMRETFANIMTKRVYTLKFERSTAVRPQMRLALQNAAQNRGVVVATPTTLKSIMLVYIETLRQLDEINQGGKVRASARENAEILGAQASELAGIIQLFHNGVMLLDEVDLLLHPLKSELNFPLGDKSDLDCSENGERWTLPVHCLDAIFFATTGKASAFEARGMALDLLRRISAVLNEGFAIKALQRLPHITLLNLEWYHSNLKPLMAEWVYLWLQKQHLHGISRQEAVTYMLEGAVARSESTGKLSVIESALDKVEADLGLRVPLTPPPPTAAHMQNMDVDTLKVFQETAALIQQQTSSSIEEDPGKKHLLEAERQELMRARDMGQKQQELFNQLFGIDEQLDSAAHESAKRVAQLQQKMVLLQKKIQEIETPRDDSFDNMTVLWASEVFGQSNVLQETMKHGELSELHAACGKLEEMGFTVRRCGSFEEAVERAAQLQATGHLRCVVAGGEAVATCGRDCRLAHDGKCLVCGLTWANHNGHTCQDGRQGSWVIKGKAADVKSIDYFKLLMTLSEWKQSDVSQVPTSRLALFAGLSSLKEDKRLALWKQGVTVTDDKDQLQEWVEGIKAWPNAKPGDKGHGEDDAEEEDGEHKDDDEDDDHAPPPMMRRESSYGLQTLKVFRQRLQKLESMKEAAHEAEDANRANLRQQAVDKHEELESEIQQQLDQLGVGLALPAQRHLPPDDVCGVVGPTSGRDAAVAMAWLSQHAQELKAEGELDAGASRMLRWSIAALRAEHKWLSQAALAAKVLAHVTAPLHKKLLNLCHDWLRTFLPHVLAKINRVSFGLLSSEDCETALEEDPNVPRSRLKLAVPFIGKDVPSKSSEFAHPDVIIGLTILAYRYTGMRYEDFVDLIDAMTTEFNLEIGPARDRPSSKRHETWVLQAGGKIRGLLRKDKSKSGNSSPIKGVAAADRKDGKGSGDTSAAAAAAGAEVEVVQLKFLQKSNKEQMDKLFELWRREPLAIHYYLCKFIFPAHMRSQKLKISASGQSVGGDMLVGRRIGFSGTPSDLLPKELGKCDYETGDDGKMLSTVLDPSIASHELLNDDWTVQSVLQRIAKSTSPRYHALIDTGALITGYSNQEVAAYLLEHGLEWCDGVVFLDENDEKQVLVRATGRAVWADQCGVPLERRFAFYDQIHTTGMDIKHVVNATAVITLGKDMVFRDYVQGAYRMRGIGAGQKIHLYIIPEVADLMRRELATCGQVVVVSNEEAEREKMLLSVVAWLVINSMLSEQMQWSMLCLQNVSNIYRKNAFVRILQGIEAFKSGTADDSSAGEDIARLPLRRSLAVFDENIDFSLEATVPDPIPFEKKLRDLLDEHNDFIISQQQHEVGHKLLVEVEELSIVGDSASRLDTEQEREQEQEQQKEIKTKREQQVEVEKFVEREYSRHQERPQPWPLSMLALDPSGVNADQAEQHPFYPLRDFHLLNQAPLCFPQQLMVSRNYFNPDWSGLRRIKNVVVVMEWAPSSEAERLRLLSAAEHSANAHLNEVQENAVNKVHTLLSFHMGEDGQLTSEGLAEAVRAATDHKAIDDDIDALVTEFGQDGKVPAEGLREMLTSGWLRPEHKGRYWIAVSLAEAETLRRVLHVRMSRAVLPEKQVELALHLSQSGQEMGHILDTSSGWCERNTGASPHETAVSHGCFRYFDGDMHYLPQTLTKLVRVLQKAHPHDRELFFQNTVAARRRIERKWQETPLSTLFTVSDEWMALKQRAQAAFVRHAVKAKGLSPWEAFIAFDADNNSRLAPSELYGALRWLQVPELTAEDVVDFFELADHNRDGMIEYSEYMTLMEVPGEKTGQNPGDDGDEEEEEEEEEGSRRKEPPAKIEPYGADELREILVRRRRNELERQKEEQARRSAQQQELDLKTYRQELLASAEREGGSNPKILLPGRDEGVLERYGAIHKENRLLEFSFGSNQHPLRTFVSGKCKYVPVLIDDVRKKLEPMRCPDQHPLLPGDFWSQCYQCKQYGTMARACNVSWSCSVYCCSRCVRGHEEEQVKERSDPAGKKTCLVCDAGCELTLQVPPVSKTIDGDKTEEFRDKMADGLFSVTVELKLNSLPPRGQLAALLRFSPKDISNSRRLHRASVYMGEGGVLGSASKAACVEDEGTQSEKAASKDSTKRAAGDADSANDKTAAASPIKVKSGRWFVLTVAIDSAQGRMHVFVDGKLSHEESGVDVRDLRLGGRIILLGGGKAAQTRGGTVRRLLLHGGFMGEADAAATYMCCVRENSATGGKLMRIQACWRGRKARKGLEADGVMQQLQLSKERREKEKQEEEE